MLLIKHFQFPLNAIVWSQNIMEVNKNQNYLVTHIFEIFYIVFHRKKESNTGLEEKKSE